MDAFQVAAAVAAAKATAAALGLNVDDAVVLHNSNRIAVRLLPCDVLARVAPVSHRPGAELELEVARQLAAPASPVAGLDPRVEPRAYLRDGFAVTLWTYHEPVPPGAPGPAEYAAALNRLHAGLRKVELTAPHFTDRIAHAQGLVGDPALTPDLGDGDRDFLTSLLRKLRSSITERATSEQLIHGEPHPGNLLRTAQGLLFIDFETCCRGPVEFDVASGPEEAGGYYPGLDEVLLGECRVLASALVAAWRWDRDDQFPQGRQMGTELLVQLRAAAQRLRRDAIP